MIVQSACALGAITLALWLALGLAGVSAAPALWLLAAIFEALAALVAAAWAADVRRGLRPGARPALLAATLALAPLCAWAVLARDPEDPRSLWVALAARALAGAFAVGWGADGLARSRNGRTAALLQLGGMLCLAVALQIDRNSILLVAPAIPDQQRYALEDAGATLMMAGWMFMGLWLTIARPDIAQTRPRRSSPVVVGVTLIVIAIIGLGFAAGLGAFR